MATQNLTIEHHIIQSNTEKSVKSGTFPRDLIADVIIEYNAPLSINKTFH